MKKQCAIICSAIVLLIHCSWGGPLEDDWLFQAGGKPTIDYVRQELLRTQELADRIGKLNNAPDLSDHIKKLHKLERKIKPDSNARKLTIKLRRIKRKIALSNPLIDFSRILAIDNDKSHARHDGVWSHEGLFNSWSHETLHRTGQFVSGTGRLIIINGLDPDADVTELVPEGTGFFWRPELSYDAKKVVFCMKPKDDRAFHLYEIGTHARELKQLTFGDYDDLDPMYTPDGKIIFTTTRGNTYVRCLPSTPAPVLARCDSDGKNIYIISRNNEADFLPAMMHDGRVLYTRWEYTDKALWRVQSLWTTNPDGTGTSVFWGNQSIWPDHVTEARAIPGSDKIIFTGVGHHQWYNGCIGIINPSEGRNYPNGLYKVTSHLKWPEAGDGPGDPKLPVAYHAAGAYHAYKSPCPLSEEYFLVSASRRVHRGFRARLYLMDVYGNMELLYQGQKNILHAIPLKAQTKPRVKPDMVAWPKIGPEQGLIKPGILYSDNVMEGTKIPKGLVKYLRIIEMDPKTYSTWLKTVQHDGPAVAPHSPESVKRILGTVPVEEDGSINFKLPAGKEVYFQLLDDQYRCVQTMRSFTGVMPGEVRGCVGCHEQQDTAPSISNRSIAQKKGPATITPPPWGAESIGYKRFVQPILDKHCGACHQGGKNPKAVAKLNMTFRNGTNVIFRQRAGHRKNDLYPFTEPYLTFVSGKTKWGKPKDKISFAGAYIHEGYGPNDPDALKTREPMSLFSYKSKLLEYATSGKHPSSQDASPRQGKVKIDAASQRRLIAWIDANCPYLGEEEIRKMDDPQFAHIETLKLHPRVKTAPEINRFNIRQDGDSTAVAEGKGHPFVCVDIHKKQVMKVDASGKVTWSYPVELPHDVWALPNGNVLFAGPVSGAVEVTPDKKIAWEFKSPKKSEKVYACQPLQNGDVMLGIAGRPARIIEVGRDGSIKKSITIPTKGLIRLIRKTRTGSYLIAARAQHTIFEINDYGKLLRQIPVPGNPYLAIQLKNGNILVACGDGHTIVEIDSNDKIVWQIKENELTGVPLRFVAGVQRLDNGNTIICNWGGHGHLGQQAQIIEVTPEKKIVWQIFDNEQFSTPTHIQLLSAKDDLYR